MMSSLQCDSFRQHLLETMPWKLHGLDYNKCAVEELQAFIKARTGLPFVGRMRKRDLCECLQQLDANFNFFHFFDLPAELRNDIYYELLTLRPTPGRVGWSCWPQILSVSKKVYDEAIGIFCDANDITIELESSLILNRRVWNMSQICLNNILLSQCTFIEDLAVGKVFTKWPTFLKNKKDLQLILRLDCRVNSSVRQHERALERVNHILYSFCCFICESRSLRELDVTIRYIHRKSKPDEWARILWPFAKISQAVRICFHELPHETDIRVRHHLKDTVAWPNNTLDLARDAVTSAPAAGDGSDQHMSTRQRNISKVRNALQLTKTVDHVFDLELTAILETISAADRNMPSV